MKPGLLAMDPRAGPPLWVPASLFALSHAYLLAYGALWWWALAPGGVRLLPFLAAVHAAAVGIGASSLLGSMAEMGSLTLMAGSRLWRAVPVLFLPGAAGLVPAMLLGDWRAVAAAGTLVLLAVAVALAAGLEAWRRRRQAGVLHVSLAAVLASLVAGMSLGVRMAATGRLGTHLLAHVFLVLDAGLGLMVMACSRQLVPLFSGRPPRRPWRGWLAPGLILLAGVAGALGLPVSLAGGAGLVGSLAFVGEWAAHVRRTPAGPFRPALWQVVVAGVWGAAGQALLAVGGGRSLPVAAACVLLGWVVPTAVAYQEWLVPLVWWNHLIRVRAGDLGVPKLPAYLREPPGAAWTGVHHAGLILLLLGYATGSAGWTGAGSLGVALAGAALAVWLQGPARVARGYLARSGRRGRPIVPPGAEA